MLSLHMIENSSWLLQILVSAFLATLFLQSGIDKVVDRRGNVEFLQWTFRQEPTRRNGAHAGHVNHDSGSVSRRP